ncbi:MAG: transposase [Desulfuromonadales bacterium]|nr:transposase [Desulfuromonadales bacterium]
MGCSRVNPYVYLDARYEKVRNNGSVIDMAVLVAIGVSDSGKRQILGASVALSEQEAHWRDFLRQLQERNLHGVKLFISDAHEGLKAAPRLVAWAEENPVEGFAFFLFPDDHWRRIRTSNVLERVNKEIRRRTRVATLFPNEDSCLRLVSAVLMEISEEWETGRTYLKM